MKRERNPVVFVGFLALVALAIGTAIASAIKSELSGYLLGSSGITLFLALCFYASAYTLYARGGKRLATVLGLLLVNVAWLLGLLLIWNARYDWLDQDQVQNIAITLLLFIPLALPILVGASLIANPLWRSTGWCLTITFATVWTILVFAPWLQWKPSPLLTSLPVLTFTAILAAVLLPATRIPAGLRYAGVGLSALAGAATMALLPDSPIEIGFFEDHRYRIGTIVLPIYAATATLAGLNGVMVPRLDRGAWLRWTSLGFLTLTIGLFYVEIQRAMNEAEAFDLRNLFDTGSVFIRWGAASLLATIASFIAFGFAVRTSFSGLGENSELLLALICPRCEEMIKISQGPQPCPACGLKFNIQVEDPTVQPS